MSLITATEINALAFITPLDTSMILNEMITAAEVNSLIPILSRAFYAEISKHPENYVSLIEFYIKPYLAYCVKALIYTQVITETGIYTIPQWQYNKVLNDIDTIAESKKTELLHHLSLIPYEPYFPTVPVFPPDIPQNRTGGFLVSKRI